MIVYIFFSIAVYKAMFPFGGYMSDVVAAVDQVRRSGYTASFHKK